METGIEKKLQRLTERHEELGALMSDSAVIGKQDMFRAYSKEYAEIEPVVQAYQQYQRTLEMLSNAKEMLRDPDPEVQLLARDEFDQAKKALDEQRQSLQILLLPKDPNDHRNVYLEIRAGTGGDEAAIFVGDLFRMYSRYAETMRWKVEAVSASPSEQGGYKEIIVCIQGMDVYSYLKFESGVHRVQRVPVTESQGRVHTSACTVAVMPEVEAVDSVDIASKDLRIDTYRASGAGGQHVNRTDSAVRITHIPTGTVVECQEERSQHKNKAKAMAWLQSKLLTAAQNAQQKEESEMRKSLVGSGDRSERIRTYNFPQGRLTDHRINLTLYQLPEILEGHLSPVVDALRQAYQMDLLSSLGG